MRRQWIVLALFGVFLLGLGAAWVVASPPGVGPDESAHYVKAVAAGRGDLRGKSPQLTAAETRRAFSVLGSRGQQAVEMKRFLQKSSTPAGRWAFRTSREFSIPAGLSNPAFGCGTGQPMISAACLNEGHATTRAEKIDSFVGAYPPFLHVGPGLGTLVTDDAATALRSGRALNALFSLSLIALGALALWEGSRGALSLTGFVVALTPAVVSYATALTPSGPEVAAGICVTASLIRIVRDQPTPIWVWGAAAASGMVLGSARSLGSLFVAALLLTIVGLVGWRRVRAAVVATPGWAIVAAAAAMVLGSAAGLWWEIAYMPGAPFGVGDFFRGIGPSIRLLWKLAKEGVAGFSALDTSLPLPGYLAWAAMLALLLAAAFAVSRGRERVLLVVLTMGVLTVTVVASAIYRQTGFELQARHILPVAVVLPLWAGELVSRHADRLQLRQSRWLLVGLTSAAAAVQLLGFYTYCRRFAVGTDGPWLFLSDAEWSPPLGWLVWLLLAGVAALAYATAGWMAANALPQPPGEAGSPS